MSFKVTSIFLLINQSLTGEPENNSVFACSFLPCLVFYQVKDSHSGRMKDLNGNRTKEVRPIRPLP